MIMSNVLLRNDIELIKLFGRGMPWLAITGMQPWALTLDLPRVGVGGIRHSASYSGQRDLPNHINQEVARLTARERDAIHG